MRAAWLQAFVYSRTRVSSVSGPRAVVLSESEFVFHVAVSFGCGVMGHSYHYEWDEGLPLTTVRGSGEGHRRSDDLLLAELGRPTRGGDGQAHVAAAAADVDDARLAVFGLEGLLDTATAAAMFDRLGLRMLVGQHGLRARLHFLGDDGLQPAGRFGQRFRGLGMCSRLQHRQRDEGTFHRYSPSVLEQR